MDKKGLIDNLNSKHIFGNNTPAFPFLDTNWVFNSKAEQLLKKNIWTKLPDLIHSSFYYEIHKAINKNKSVHTIPLVTTHEYSQNGNEKLIEDILFNNTWEVLERQKREFENVAHYLTDVVLKVNRNMNIVYANRAVENSMGVSAELIIGKRIGEVGLPESICSAVIQTGRSDILEFSCSTLQGERYYLARFIPEYNFKGETSLVLIIIQDITERKEAEKRKEEFISMVSHELKTPITSIKAYVQILGKKMAKSRNRTIFRHIEKIEGQINKLTTLISDLLDVSRIQNKKLEFKKEEFEFNTFLHEVIENIQSITSTHKIILQNAINKCIVKADRDRLSQVMINLLINAITYSPDAKEVVVRTDIRDNKIIVQVVDFGIGIREEHKHRIFERFYRVHNTEGKLFPGLGIGLYISKEIIFRHGGDIWVESEEGKGSVFTIAIPV